MHNKPIAAGKSSFDLVDIEKLFSELNLREDGTFLDLACGRGAYALEASRRFGPGGHIWAFDLWKEGIEALEKKIADQHIGNIVARRVDISKHIPLDDHSIDVCLMSTVLHDLIQDNTDRGTLVEVSRVLKEKGTLAVIEFQKVEGPPGPPIHIKMSPGETKAYLCQYNFGLIQTMSIGPYNYLSLFTH
jgi:ubiquinone/menaquinone biosynthesis C-methylase UbiE